MCKLYQLLKNLLGQNHAIVSANSSKKQHYFKYKSLSGDSFRYFVQLLLDQRMYAATFDQLNDPMEGVFLTKDVLDEIRLEEIKSKKNNYRIISMVRKNNNDIPASMLMWSHYADEHRGCCIEFHFANEEDEKSVRDIKYVSEVSEVSKKGSNCSLETILCRKLTDWGYENEVRYIKQMDNEQTVPIVIDKIFFGMRIDDMYNPSDHTNQKFYKDLVNRLCKGVDVHFVVARNFEGMHINTRNNE